MDDSELTQSQEELSITLVERRKRLHVLATEINNWENEANKNPNYLETLSTPPQHSNAPSTSILSFDRTTPTGSFYSPKNYQINKSPAMYKQQSSPNCNKENLQQSQESKSPSKRKLNETTTLSSSTLTNSEILNVAHRILNKKQSNSALCQPKVSKFTNNQESLSAGSVKNIQSRFESNKSDNPDSRDSTCVMTPRSIIKKFEQMSRDCGPGSKSGNHSNPVSTQTSQSSLAKISSSSLDSAAVVSKLKQSSLFESKNEIEPITPSIFPSLKKIQVIEKPVSSNNIYSEHIHPKSIIQKFEQMVKNNAQQEAENTEPGSMPKSISSNTNISSVADTNIGSLTYISSVVSEVSPRTFEDGENDDDEEENIEADEYDSDQNETYKLNDRNYQEDSNDNSEGTSLFEEDNEEITPSSRTENCEIYSLSSSYSGSCINDEFDDIDENSINEDMTATEIYSEYIESDRTYQIESTASYSPSETEFNEHVDIEAVATFDKKENIRKTSLIPPKSPTRSNVQNEEQCSEPLFSIKEYRKQKKHVASGLPANSYRRSSVSTAFKNKEVNSAEKSKKAVTPNRKPENQAHITIEDVALKKTKYLERIKELDEMIKQEDNIIHQTGIALERCLTDTLFTGSSEHIECNRILLISCQKRQAYSTEIGRLKQLIDILVKKKPVQQVLPATVDEYSGLSDVTPIDLTGLLIFSDLQLPIKESYLNKLKSGDEKRIFYFLCLIRNGIQVLQTQVISVQELIATRDSSITFPNRMAISNVDVNFKVKIDIYTLEITPKEIKHSKSTSLASTSKFFSPFKNSLFHSSHDSSSSNNNSNSNHHYIEQLSLGVSTGGAKTSNFIHIDTIEITNRDLSSNRFKLSISSSSIPLTGVLFVTVRCMPSKSIELKGFMTLLEDVKGLRSWDRRWCFLNNYNISYWKYPEDEYKTSPIGVINLTNCVNDKVAILPRDICARKYTFELGINEGSGGEDDNNNRYRLSADTKDQANDWLTNVNYALANLKLWNPKSNKPAK